MSENDKQDETQPVRPEGAAAPAPPAASPSSPSSSEASSVPSPEAGEAPVAAAAPTTWDGRRGFRERFRTLRRADGSRAYGLGALIASALAGIIVGGIGMAAVHAITSDHRDGPGWSERRGPMGRDFGGDRDRDGDRRGPRFLPGGPGGGVQPTTPPEDDEDSGSSS